MTALTSWKITEAKEGLLRCHREKLDAERRAEEFATKLRAAAILLGYPENKFIDEIDEETEPFPTIVLSTANPTPSAS